MVQRILLSSQVVRIRATLCPVIVTITEYFSVIVVSKHNDNHYCHCVKTGFHWNTKTLLGNWIVQHIHLTNLKHR